jgi:hypothetical protein
MTMARSGWFLVAVAAAVLGGCACPGAVGANCTTTKDCQGQLACLDTKVCATACTADAGRCASGEKCSASGGCVPSSGCGSDRDCVTGQACTSAGTCAQSCQGAGSCGSTAVCLASGTCAGKCTSAADCASGERCSSVGGCVPANGCGAKEDCAAGQLCDAVGKCQSDCRTTGCLAGSTCASDGQCVAAAADGGAMTCGGERFQATKVNSNMLIAFDKSGSMRELINGTSKWDIATGAITQVTQQYEQQIQFGLMLFPAGGTTAQECVPASLSVPVGTPSATSIASVLNMNGPGGKTPIGGVLTAAGQVTTLADPLRANYVMLVTDGSETSGGDGVAAATANLMQRGIKTVVIGFGNGVNGGTLADIATAGGTPRPGTPKYYQADDAPALLAAFNQIAQGALGCEYRLASAPPDPAKVYVYVNGVLQNRDVAHANGWDYAAPTQRVTFYGNLCTLVATDATARVSIVYGCPDGSLVEVDRRDGGAGLPNGSACTVAADCANGQCLSSVCGAPVGARCTTGTDCASTICTNGTCQPGIN